MPLQFFNVFLMECGNAEWQLLVGQLRENLALRGQLCFFIRAFVGLEVTMTQYPV